MVFGSELNGLVWFGVVLCREACKLRVGNFMSFRIGFGKQE